ncbi:MAG: metallophosphoesterase [Methylococcaceae bacterium]|nr:metallophosphoesterase [Methylococcaceae bacterium]
MLNIEIIGTIDGQRHYDIETIKKLLLLASETLMVGHDFVGRPGTQIHASETNVIKIRTELNFNKDKARRWIKQALEKERQLAVHHPYKTWLLITQHQNESEAENIAIASICPRLKPLHIELKATPNSNSERQQYLHLLQAVFSMYLTLAKNANVKLDEGLSNFAVSNEGIVYYLDDEYYQWDKFISFSMMLGVYIRTFEWLDEAFIIELGNVLIELLNSIFHDDHCCAIIARQLQSLFMPQGQKERLLNSLISTLTPQQSTLHKAKSLQVPSRFFALLADVHSNYSALDCVLNYLEAHDIHQGIVLGDIVGYNAEPSECIERLQNTNLNIIQGNHDHAVAINDTSIGFSSTAKFAIDWTINQLSLEQRQWLKDLPVFEETEDWLAVHGAPIDPAFFYGYVYAMTYENNLSYMQDNNIRLCFHGHSHMEGVYARDKNRRDHHITEKKVALPAYNQLLVCPGSIGQPRNNCTDTQFAIYDREQQEVTFLALPYNNQPAVQKMRDHDFPEALWKRLLIGK